MLEKYKQHFANDQFAQSNGIKLIDAKPGYAKTQVEIKPNHLNGAGVIHGGLLFTLADFAVAVATNTYQKVSLTINSDISYFAAAKCGIITAEAKELSRSNRLSTCNVDILDDNNKLLSSARMTVYITHQEIEF